MDRKLMDAIEDNLWQVLADYAKGFKSPADVETVKHALSGIFKIRCLEEMEEFKGGSYRGGRSMDGGSYRYYDDGSFRGNTGVSRGSYRYSRDGGNMRDRLEMLKNDAADEHQRHIIQEMIDRL